MSLFPKSISRFALVAIFLFFALTFIVYERTHKQRIFILHSYHSKMSWVKGLEMGVAQVFNHRRYVDIRHFYMNTKRKHSEAYLKRIKKEALKAIKAYNPDIIIVFDSMAQRLVASKLINHPKYKIVVAGVMDSSDLERFESANNITGVLEVIPVKAITEVLTLMIPHKKRVFYLSDDSQTAKALDKQISNENWGTYRLVGNVRAKTFAQWKKAINKAQKITDVILISTYQTISQKRKPYPLPKMVEWTQNHSRKPVIGLYESFVNDGGFLAISVASFEQGYTAAKIALFLLEKKIQINDLSFVKSQMFQLQMRKHNALKKYPNIQIPVILEAFSKTKWHVDDLMINKRLRKLKTENAANMKPG